MWCSCGERWWWGEEGNEPDTRMLVRAGLDSWVRKEKYKILFVLMF